MVLFPAAKTTFKCVLQNQAQIDYDNENDDNCDGSGDTFDEFGDETTKAGQIPWLFSLNIPILGTITW